MPRLRNSQSGAVVSVSEATAARLGSEWVSADAKPAEKKAPAKKSASSKSEK